jgi:YesN/AraC family two-component response regulator
MGILLFIIFFQNKKLKTAYSVLVDRSVEITKIQEYAPKIISESIINTIPEISLEMLPENIDENNSEDTFEKKQKSTLSEKSLKELLNKVLDFMEISSEIYNPEFTLDKLAELIHSNHLYVSFVLNNVLQKNFRSFLNSYRIREALRLFSDANTSKFSIEFVANKVGYKSRTSFDEAFKKITGVTPAFYTKSLIEKQSNH